VKIFDLILKMKMIMNTKNKHGNKIDDYRTLFEMVSIFLQIYSHILCDDNVKLTKICWEIPAEILSYVKSK
jgi:hypothetical protein